MMTHAALQDRSVRLLILLPIALAAMAANAAEAPVTAGTREVNLASLHRIFYGDVIATAAQIDAKQYSFRPTPEVRSFGELFGHIASGSYTICALAQNQEPPEHGRGLEKRAEELGKKGLIEVLEESRSFCERAYATAQATPSERATGALSEVLFEGQPVSAGDALAFQLAHLSDHYGNLATYLRLIGEVPPSTQRQQQRQANQNS